MKPVYAIIIDPEKHARDILKWEIEEHLPEVLIVSSSESLSKGIQEIKRWKPDLVFVEIQFPHEDGFKLLRQIPSYEGIDWIITSASSSHALEAFQFGASGYMLKPVDGHRLQKVVCNIIGKRNQYKQRSNHEAAHQLLSGSSKRSHTIALPTQHGLEFVLVDQIIRCEADNNYSRVILSNKIQYLVSKPLKYLEHMLADYAFFRIHKCHLINLNFMKSYFKGEGGYIILQDGTHLTLARSRKHEFLSLFRV